MKLFASAAFLLAFQQQQNYLAFGSEAGEFHTGIFYNDDGKDQNQNIYRKQSDRDLLTTTANVTVAAPVKAPVTAPVTAPVIAKATKALKATKAPKAIKLPKVVVLAPTPVTSPTKPAPVTVTAPAPVPVTALQAQSAPIKAPVKSPVAAPVIAPIVTSPDALSSKANVTYASLPLRINAGYGNGDYTDTFDDIWVSEVYLVDNVKTTKTKSLTSQPIRNTFDDVIYQYVREGANFGYQIPVPVGNYEITLHMVELEYDEPKQRVFDVQVENETVSNIDIIAQGGGKFGKFTIALILPVDDGMLDINFRLPQNTTLNAGLPVIAGIEIDQIGMHLAHAVSGGPYTAIDKTNSGYALVRVDASNSHTHGENMDIISVKWTEKNKVIGTQLAMTMNLSVGEHEVTVWIKDSGNTTSADQTTITIHPAGYPSVVDISPRTGSLGGMEEVYIIGSGFTFTTNQTSVVFGDMILKGDDMITIVNSTAIKVLSPPSVAGKDVPIQVQTPRGVSTERQLFTYEAAAPIKFTDGLVFALRKVARCKFGPDRHLYVSTIDGKLGRYLLNLDTLDVRTSMVQQVVEADRAILGLAFDPMEPNEQFPNVYFSHSDFFHKNTESSSGLSINGKISRVQFSSQTNSFTTPVHVITGLPISDLDHGLNAIEFGNNGELYIAIGSMTNGGKPGKLSSSGLLKENYFSAAIVVAYLQSPNFSGTIKYTATDDGSPITSGIEVFGHGLRNPFGIMVHSNGKLYSSDNGSNPAYGAMMTGCGPNDFIPGQLMDDKIIHVEKGKYYGSPNPKRASFLKDPRQCIWHPTSDPSGNGFTAPIAVVPSSMAGIIEYTANYFNGQLRGNIIGAKYGDELYRIVLTPDGTAAVAESRNGIPMSGDKGLDVTLTPDGTFIEARHTNNTVNYQKPIEPATDELKIYSVFPYRGRSSGGNVLSIYGVNFTPTSKVTVGGVACTAQVFVSSKQIDCTLPGGKPDLIDITVTQGTVKADFLQGYRYITGLPETP